MAGLQGHLLPRLHPAAAAQTTVTWTKDCWAFPRFFHLQRCSKRIIQTHLKTKLFQSISIWICLVELVQEWQFSRCYLISDFWTSQHISTCLSLENKDIPKGDTCQQHNKTHNFWTKNSNLMQLLSGDPPEDLSTAFPIATTSSIATPWPAWPISTCTGAPWGECPNGGEVAVATQLAGGGERSPVKLEMVKPVKQFGVDDVLLILPKSGAFERANPEILEGIGQSKVFSTCFDTCCYVFFWGGREIVGEMARDGWRIPMPWYDIHI